MSQTAPHPADPPPASFRLAVGDRLLAASRRIQQWPGWLSLPLKPLCVVLEGATQGLLRRDDVDALVARSYAGQPDFYDPEQYQLPHEQRILPDLLERAGDRRRLLDAFCGQGREAEIFSRAGFEVLGVDALPWMIERARAYAAKSGFEAEFTVADFHDLAPETPFDVVYTSCWMYSTLQGVDRRLRFLRQCRRLCAGHGLVVMSYIDAAAFPRSSRWVRFLVARATGWMTAGNRRTEAGERIYGGLFWHHLDAGTVRRELRECGLETVLVSRAVKPYEPTFVLLRPASEPA